MSNATRISRWLEAIREAGLFRSMRTVTAPRGPEFMLDGKFVVNFSGNDSLGLAGHPDVMAGAVKAVEDWGAGAGASRLTCGNLGIMKELEDALAAFFGTGRTLLFSSGFQANAGAIPALVDTDTIILSDAHNHASLIDGIRLSRARCIVYPHNDVDAIERLMAGLPDGGDVMVVTESLFSMDGDRAPLDRIFDLKDRRPFTLYLDEAHAVGNLGPGGRGLAAEHGRRPDVLLGTLGKAFGSSGAFVAAAPDVVDLLVNRARSFIFSTAPTPASAGAALAALHIVEDGHGLRDRLRANAGRLREGLGSVIGEAPGGIDHIVPVPWRGARRVMEASAALLERGVFCQGIRPPSVPAGGCVLRFSASAAHEERHIDAAVAALSGVVAGGVGKDADET